MEKIRPLPKNTGTARARNLPRQGQGNDNGPVDIINFNITSSI